MYHTLSSHRHVQGTSCAADSMSEFTVPLKESMKSLYNDEVISILDMQRELAMWQEVLLMLRKHCSTFPNGCIFYPELISRILTSFVLHAASEVERLLMPRCEKDQNCRHVRMTRPFGEGDSRCPARPLTEKKALERKL